MIMVTILIQPSARMRVRLNEEPRIIPQSIMLPDYPSIGDRIEEVKTGQGFTVTDFCWMYSATKSFHNPIITVE
jgi:hypothetical protein